MSSPETRMRLIRNWFCSTTTRVVGDKHMQIKSHAVTGRCHGPSGTVGVWPSGWALDQQRTSVDDAAESNDRSGGRRRRVKQCVIACLSAARPGLRKHRRRGRRHAGPTSAARDWVPPHYIQPADRPTDRAAATSGLNSGRWPATRKKHRRPPSLIALSVPSAIDWRAGFNEQGTMDDLTGHQALTQPSRT